MGNKGFSLVELMIVVLLISLLTASLGGLLVSGMQTFTCLNNKIELQQNLRYGLYNVITEIKNARQVIDITDNEITLLNRNNKAITYNLARDPQSREHLYQISGRNLYRYTERAKQPVANFIEDISFKPKPGYKHVHDISYISVSIQGRTTSGKKIKLNSGAELKWKSFAPLLEES